MGEKTSYDEKGDDFKTHFRSAQHDLKIIRGLTMHQEGCHYANSIVSPIREDVKNQLESTNNELLSVLHSISLLTLSSSDSDGSQDDPTHHANISTTDMVKLEILKIFNQM